MNNFRRFVLASVLLPLFAGVSTARERPLHLELIKLPPGFSISVYARIEDARSMTVSPSGIVYVGNRNEQGVYAVLPPKNGAQPVVMKILDNLRVPNGVAFHDGALYVAQVDRILKFPDIEKDLAHPRQVLVTKEYPTDENHGWKFIAFGPDGKLYVPVGAPCNICESKDPIFGTITRINPDGTGREIFARGIRNSVGFDWKPDTHELWFTDNGRDNLGDDVPSDELNRAPKAGLHFGYPYFHARGIRDPEFGDGKRREDYVEPEQELGPHVAALGMRFYTGAMFPSTYKGRIFIAQHGSWNRSTKIGYRVMVVKLVGNRVVDYKPFATGWLQNGEAWGRPVDVQPLADGSLLVSDDYSGTIYCITYRG